MSAASGHLSVVDVERLKRSWATVAAYGDKVALRFYSRLFVIAPEARDMFPLSMVDQRDRFVIALGRTVAYIDRLDQVRPFLEHLGRDHRRFGVTAEHYPPVGATLLETLADFLGDEWSPELAHDWEQAYQIVAGIMIDAARRDEQQSPGWWKAELVAHQRRTFDVAVLTVRPEQPYGYVPGQSMLVEVPNRPNQRRYYSPANAPRRDGSVDFHVRRVPGGRVSAALVDDVVKGDIVCLGPPVGNRLLLRRDAGRDVLLIAGGTGLAPLKALAEQVTEQNAAAGTTRKVTLFVGARTPRELYDMEDLHEMETRSPWLTVVSSVVDLPPGNSLPFPGRVEQGVVGEVASRRGRWPGHDVYVCGSDAMVMATVQWLRDAGCSGESIFYEGFQGIGGDMHGVTDVDRRYGR